MTEQSAGANVRGAGEIDLLDRVDNPLAQTATRFSLNEASAEELTLVFAESRVFCRKEEEVGFAAVGSPGSGWIPVYSSDLALARGEGPCEWFSAPGLEVIELIPENYGVILDRGSSSEVFLEPWAIKRPADRLEDNGNY